MSTFFIALLVTVPVCCSAINLGSLPIVPIPPLKVPDVNFYPCNLNNPCQDDYSLLELWYFDQNNGVTVFKLNESEALLKNSAFQSLPLINMYISGFTDGINSKTSQYMINSYTNQSIPIFYFNTFPYTSSTVEIIRSYAKAAYHTCCIGKILGKFLCALTQGGVDINNIYVVVHSLGGQMIGCVARAYEEQCGHKLVKVSAVDPAGPCFDSANSSFVLSANDAINVHIYHTNRNGLGSNHLILPNITHFIANGEGYMQPQCNLDILCSHYFSTFVWAQSVKGNRIYATKCPSWYNYKNGLCEGNDKQLVGDPSSNTASGIYYFKFDTPFVYNTVSKIVELVGATF